MYGSATADTSASPRPVHVVLTVCQVGFDSYAEQPEPEPFQADSVQPRAVPLRVSEVPPTAVTYRDEAGNSAPQPLSPALAVMATPGWFRYDWSTSVSLLYSSLPQLLDTNRAPCATAWLMAANMSLP